MIKTIKVFFQENGFGNVDCILSVILFRYERIKLQLYPISWPNGNLWGGCYLIYGILKERGLRVQCIITYDIFLWLCAWDVCCIIFCHLLHIHSGKNGILFSLLLCRLWWMQISDTFWLADGVRLFVHYTISLLPLCKVIWRHWTYKMPVRYILSSVRVRLSIFSQLSIIQYKGLCVFSWPIFLVMIERIYTLSYYHQQIDGIMQKGPYPPCLRMADKALLAGYPRLIRSMNLSIA